MISLKTARELEQMRKACTISAQALKLAGEQVKAGMSTHELDTIIREFIYSKGAKASFLGYGGFPGSICASVNEQVVHGIPGHRRLREGDIISIDLGACLHGFHSDMARTCLLYTSDAADEL